MAEAAWEIYLEDQARAFLDTLEDAEKEELERLFILIELDPWIDGRVKVKVDLPPAVVTANEQGQSVEGRPCGPQT